MLGRVIGLLCMLSCVPSAAAAAIADFQHMQWKTEGGAPADIRSMAQTVDGWLWLGTSGGLYRFDGTHFERAAGELGHLRIHELYAGPTGDLYIGEYGGALRVRHPDGRLQTLSGKDGTAGAASAMAQDRSGNLWIIDTAIRRWDGQHWLTVDADPAWEKSDISSLAIDRDDVLWAAHDHGIKRLDRRSGTFTQVDDHGGGSLSLAPDGTMWLLPKDGKKVWRLTTATGTGMRPARFNPSGSRFAGLFDGAGTLWKLRCPDSLCLDPQRQPGAPAKTDQPRWQLSGSDPRQILEDREGVIWIATQHGLDRFRPSRLRSARLAASSSAVSMAANAEGQLWAADRDSGSLWQLAMDGSARKVPGPPVDIVAPDSQGGILLGGRRSIWRQAHGRRTEIPFPRAADGKPADAKVLVLLDDGKVVWAAGPGIGLIGWFDGAWHAKSSFNLPDKLYVLRAAGPGQIWAGQAGGGLIRYDNGKLTRFDASAAGFLTTIIPGREFIVGGDGGLGVLRDGRIRMLRAADTDVLRGISGMVVTPDGDHWLNGAAGIVHVRARDWAQAMAQPDAELRYELFDTLDGYPGRALIETSQPSAVSSDGRHLWFIGTEGIALLDAAALYRNAVRPAPAVSAIQAGRELLAPGATAQIPAGADRFALRFTAPSLRMPERIRFEYRLDGFDRAWQDAGARRIAEYTNVPPGGYVFRVRAYNEDGLAGLNEAAQPLRIAPTLTQTLWFRTLAGLVLLALAAALYTYRIRRLTARVIERIQVKTAERERIARTLHDSFLQSVQALLMQVDTTASKLPADTATRQELDTIRERARNALVEGRRQLSELRADDIALDAALEQRLDELRAAVPATRFTLSVEGSRRTLPAALADEIGQIAAEALRNAALHANASVVNVALSFGKRALSLRIADDGCGLDKDILRADGRPGHWGIRGMRERAKFIGALLVIDSQAGIGTTVRLDVPA